MFCVPARAQEVEVGAGLLCDNAAEVTRYFEIVNGDPQAAANQVNVEVNNPTACVLVGVAFIRGQQGEAIRNADGAWKVTEVLVVAVHTPMGWRQIAPHVYFTAIRVAEQEANYSPPVRGELL